MSESAASHRQEPTYQEYEGPFSITCTVEVNIHARPETVWRLLTDAKDFSRWSSMVSGIDGEIREGERIVLHVPGAPRTFSPVVSEVVPNRRMTWTGGSGLMFAEVRAFELAKREDGSTDFAMQERFSGLMLPFVRSAMIDFRGAFEHFAHDLKHEAERATS